MISISIWNSNVVYCVNSLVEYNFVVFAFCFRHDSAILLISHGNFLVASSRNQIEDGFKLYVQFILASLYP